MYIAIELKTRWCWSKHIWLSIYYFCKPVSGYRNIFVICIFFVNKSSTLTSNTFMNRHILLQWHSPNFAFQSNRQFRQENNNNKGNNMFCEWIQRQIQHKNMWAQRTRLSHNFTILISYRKVLVVFIKWNFYAG